MLTKRVSLLFDENMWKTLVLLAKKRGTSVSDLVRTAIRKQYFEEDRTKQIEKAVASIRAFHKKYGEKLSKNEDVITIMRKARTNMYKDWELLTTMPLTSGFRK